MFLNLPKPHPLQVYTLSVEEEEHVGGLAERSSPLFERAELEKHGRANHT